MARARSPERDKAFEMWNESGGRLPLRHIAETLGIPEKSVSGWKCKDRWEEKVSGVLQLKKRSTPKKRQGRKPQEIQNKESVIKEPRLTEKQRLFCLYYVKCFNATQAAIKAGYSKDTAHVIGWENLRKLQISAEIKRLKGSMLEDLYIDAMDVLHKYLQLAFADVTDFVEFGQKEVPILTMFGPAKDEEGNILTKLVNFVDFKSSTDIDGTIIQEVKQSKEGVAIKFADRMKALEKLERYFDLLPDHHKRRIEEERLKLDREKLSLEKAKTGDPEDTQDDGFMSALEGKIGDAWDDYEDGDDDAEA